MGTTIDNAVGELIKRQHGTISYTDNGKEVVVLSKPAHYTLSIKLIDKVARKNKKSSIRLDKTYTYPKDIEGAVLWDALYAMQKAIIDYTGKKGIESWNNIFGEKYPQLFIGEHPIISGTKYGYGTNANAYIAGYHKAERKLQEQVTDMPSKDFKPASDTKEAQ